MRFADMVPLILPGQGTVQAQPPRLWSSMESKSLNGSNVGQQSGDGLDEVLGAIARPHWNSRRCVLESKEFGDVQLSRISIPTRDTVAACVTSCKRP